MAVLPADQPRYLITIMLDEPQGLPETHGFATSGWNAAPTAAQVIERDRAAARTSSRASICRRRTSSFWRYTKQASR